MSKENNLKDYLTDLYQGIASKKPNASRNPQNFRREIESIETGITPTGDLSITKNGTYDVTNKASATVIVPIPSGYIKPSGSKTITENGTHNVKEFESVEVNVASGGGGECSGNHIIEVDTLPTENISRNDIYKMGDRYYKVAKELKDVIAVQDGSAMSLVDVYAEFSPDVTVNFYYVDAYENVENPMIFMDESTMSINIYYDASRNDVFVYEDGEWVFFDMLEGLTSGGTITDISQATTDGYYYALLGTAWKAYGNPYVIEVDELPTENIDTDAIYCVKTTECVDATIPFGSLGVIKWEAYCKNYGLSYNVFNVDALPTENIGETIDGVSSYLYYVTSENKIYTYQGGVWTTEWLDEDVAPVMGVTISYYTYGTNGFELLSSSATKDVEVNTQIKHENLWGDGSRYLTYTLSDDGTYYTFDSLQNCPLKNWVIASEINGIPVTEMNRPSSFSGSSSTPLNTVVIPDTIPILQLRAFGRALPINVLVIGKGVTSIGDYSTSEQFIVNTVYYAGTQEEWEAIEGRNNISYTNIIYGS